MTISLREALAALCHEQWSGWMRHMLSKCNWHVATMEPIDVRIPAGYVANLARQMTTPYAELSEAEKESDRREADKFLAILGLVESPVTGTLQLKGSSLCMDWDCSCGCDLNHSDTDCCETTVTCEGCGTTYRIDPTIRLIREGS